MKAKLLAINSDSEVCEVCGKTHLKRVMWIETEETGVRAYGVCCGAKALGFNGKFNTIEQVVTAIENSDKLDKARESAKKMAIEFNDEIAIIKNNNSYICIRGKAYDADSRRYGFPVEWVK